jgi:hypothetical protein
LNSLLKHIFFREKNKTEKVFIGRTEFIEVIDILWVEYCTYECCFLIQSAAAGMGTAVLSPLPHNPINVYRDASGTTYGKTIYTVHILESILFIQWSVTETHYLMCKLSQHQLQDNS